MWERFPGEIEESLSLTDPNISSGCPEDLCVLPSYLWVSNFGTFFSTYRHLKAALDNQQENLSRLHQHKQTQDSQVQQNNALLKTTYEERTKVKVHLSPSTLHLKCSSALTDCVCVVLMSTLLQSQSRRLQQEISELQNVEEPQSEDLVPLVCNQHTCLCTPSQSHAYAHPHNRMQTKDSNLSKERFQPPKRRFFFL